MHVKLTIQIDSGNAAFGDTASCALMELTRIMRLEAARLLSRQCDGSEVLIRDANGNVVGRLYLEITEDEG